MPATTPPLPRPHTSNPAPPSPIWPLVCHPATPGPIGIQISVQAYFSQTGLKLHYRLQGDLRQLALPTYSASEQTGQFTDGLWQHTCLEAFLARPGQARLSSTERKKSSAGSDKPDSNSPDGNGPNSSAEDTEYTEYNFSPCGRYAIYAFSQERQRNSDYEIQHQKTRPHIPIHVSRDPAHNTLHLQTELHLPLWGLGTNTTNTNANNKTEHTANSASSIQAGFSAVLETKHGQLSYWALHHPKPSPDFHDPRGRIACIQAQ